MEYLLFSGDDSKMISHIWKLSGG